MWSGIAGIFLGTAGGATPQMWQSPLALAPVIIDDISEAIGRLHEQGLTILLVEQNSMFALRHADRLALVENGAIELEGTAREFRESEYVRDAYIGVT